MAVNLKSIPHLTSEIPGSIRRILDPMRDALERRFLGGGDERVITRADLKQLGMVTDKQLRALDG